MPLPAFVPMIPVSLTLLVVAAVTGCSGEAADGTVGAAEVRDQGYDCGHTWDDQRITWTVTSEGGRVPRGFEPVEAVWCKTPDVSRDGSTPELTVTERRSTVLDPLVARFETADAPEDLAVECAAMHFLEYIPARIWLLDADGRAMLGHSPMGVCGPNAVGIDEAFPADD